MSTQTPQTPYVGFFGGVGSVTGANFLLKTDTASVLIDCGLFQGKLTCDERNSQPFPFDVASIDALIVTHAHVDHVGRIPKLVKDGFKGTIYSTEQTRALAKEILADASRIIEQEAIECGTDPAYRPADVKPVFDRWEALPYYTKKAVGDISVYLKDAGHVLGSAFVECSHNSFGKIVFSGDLGNSPSPLLRDTDEVTDAQYMVVESVYGDREHEPEGDRLSILEDVIEGVIAKKGTLLIPAFSLERTQMLIYDINMLVENRRIPRIPVFLDSPLAIKMMEVYRKGTEFFNEETQKIIKGGDDIFAFEGLKLVVTPESSKTIHESEGAKIIIAGSGMSHGGRIIYHEKHYLSDPKTTLLIVGYQAPGSLGRQLQDGVATVTIGDVKVEVRAQVETLRAYSGHRDIQGLLEFVGNSSRTLKKVFVAMGEPKSSQFLVQRLRDYLGINAVFPEAGDTITLE